MTPAQAPARDLAARLEDPEVAQALGTLLDHADLLAVLVEGLDQFVARSEVIGASLSSGVSELRQTVRGTDPETQLDLAALANAARSLASTMPRTAPRIVEAVENGSIDRLTATLEVAFGALPQVQLLAAALINGTAEFNHAPIEVNGPFSLLKLLRDPDINRALSFFATVAKAAGRELDRLDYPTT